MAEVAVNRLLIVIAACTTNGANAVIPGANIMLLATRYLVPVESGIRDYILCAYIGMKRRRTKRSFQ